MKTETLTEWKFDGSDYLPVRDNQRLIGQMLDIFLLMKDGKYRSMGAIEEELGYPQASISAQLRHLRKDRFGGHKVEKKYMGNGLYLYRLEVKS